MGIVRRGNVDSSFFMAKSTAASVSTPMRPRKYSGDYLNRRRRVKRQNTTYLYFGNVENLLHSYAINNVITKAVAKTEAFKQLLEHTAVSSGDAIKDEALMCADKFFKQRTQSALVKRFPVNILDSMRTYWVPKPTMHLRQLVQCANTLMWLGGNTLISWTRAASARSAGQGGLSNHQKNQCREGFCAEWGREHSIVTPAENPSAIKMSKTEINLSENIHVAASLTTPIVTHCRLCPARVHTMTKGF